ncbi:MAG: hypothetical protein Q9168_007326 [Polycauliona sp. 1 TL-2023]
MPSSSFIALFALLITVVAGDFAHSLTCHASSDYLTATSSLIAHGSQVGSYNSPSTRCPRAKPTTTITSVITSGVSVVPTSHGFTPISSETYSATSTPNKDISSVVMSFDVGGPVTSVGESTISFLICGPSEPSTSSPIPTTCPSLSTVTTSTTVTTPSTISYAACGSDNIRSFVTDPAHDNQTLTITRLTLLNVTAATTLSDIGVSDCCAACQTLGCAYGRWTSYPYAFCELYFQETCDGKEWLGSTFSYYTPGSSSPGFSLFNGPCGQIVQDGPTT